MNKSEIQRLLELPVEERLRLAELLRRSVHRDDEVRFVPDEAADVRLVRECLEALEQGSAGVEVCEVLEA